MQESMISLATAHVSIMGVGGRNWTLQAEIKPCKLKLSRSLKLSPGGWNWTVKAEIEPWMLKTSTGGWNRTRESEIEPCRLNLTAGGWNWALEANKKPFAPIFAHLQLDSKPRERAEKKLYVGHPWKLYVVCEHEGKMKKTIRDGQTT